RDMGMRLVRNMEEALNAGEPAAAQLVAAECVTLAELKDHFNWELIGQAAKGLDGAEAKALKGAYQEVEDQEDEHFYHSKGWARVADRPAVLDARREHHAERLQLQFLDAGFRRRREVLLEQRLRVRVARHAHRDAHARGRRQEIVERRLGADRQARVVRRERGE